MPVTLKTPGVYVEEISTLPPSVAEVSTAIPAFLGYTEIGYTEKGSVLKINTLLEYKAAFGGPKPAPFAVTATLDSKNVAQNLTINPTGVGKPSPEYLMYYCLAHYFRNGGGPCYIIPVGKYDTTLKGDDFRKGLALLAQEDEPTLIVLTDAINLDPADYFGVCEEALQQCAKLKDRFLIVDVPRGEVAQFRNGMGMANLSYAAAYYPYLETTLTLDYGDENNVTVELTDIYTASFPSDGNGITVTYDAPGDTAVEPKLKLVAGDGGQLLEFGTALNPPTLTITNTAGRTGAEITADWTKWKVANPGQVQGFDVKANGDGSANVTATAAAGADLTNIRVKKNLADYATTKTGLYNQIKDVLSRQRVTLPPSAAIAGVYARVDRSRGVWKAPANETVMAVLGPVAKITDEGQEDLNIDATAGKSINVIRQFIGKGTLVWGARTLAGNDNEWRYVSVRRLFVTIEESTKKASAFAVFEPNDATTWLKVKGMIESYLFSLWERGALAGSKPEAAYYVNVGLGKTMTPQDVLEGRLIVEIGIAAVRPAEFIVLRFMHKLQEA